MACSGKCTLTEYQVEFKVLESSRTGDCGSIDLDAAIRENLLANFRAEQVGCDEACVCLKYPGQEPKPTALSPEFEYRHTFTVEGTTCAVTYKAVYQYQVKLFDGACARAPLAAKNTG